MQPVQFIQFKLIEQFTMTEATNGKLRILHL